MMKLHLLDHRYSGGYASFGSYWSKGEKQSDDFRLVDETGKELPVQTRIAAWWPDGSVKWASHTADSRLMGNEVSVVDGKSDAEHHSIEIIEKTNTWQIQTERMSLEICKSGSERLAENICLCGQLRVSRIVPVMQLERRAEKADGTDIWVKHTCTRVENVCIETAGPLECVIRYSGYYESREQLMPFIIRMYIGLDTDDIRFDHTLVYNGVEERDFLKAVGIRFDAPLSGAAYNHHVKYAVDYGVFHEPAILMESRIPRTGPGMKIRQLADEPLLFEPGTPEAAQAEAVANDLPVWNAYMLTQMTADSFRLQKRTKSGRCMLNVRTGHHAPGAMSVYGEDGGIMLALRDFWQRFPSGLSVEDLGSSRAACTIWFYSPQAEAYDFRHYDDRAYPYSSYEGFEKYGASADGIATTSQCSIRLVNECIPNELMETFNRMVQKPAVYVASPEFYHEKRVFGYWSLPTANTEAERDLEHLLETAVEFYKTQIKQRSWYGLFDYGDIMHSYDAQRHTWKYDIGGYAWQNTELVPTYWLWLYFLRTGREDVFSLAEAMSRHCSETDIYHFGPMKGIGSRHNVRHWGCPCKEPRVSMAGHHRPLFYLTGDRRLGDVFDEVISASDSLDNLYFYHGASSREGRPNARTGPDWSSFVSNWMTAYERTLNDQYRKKIEAGLEGISRAPMRLGSGPAFSFDKTTGDMHYIGESKHDIHLSLCMGGPQVWMETADMLDNALMRDMLEEYGKIYLMTEEERAAAYGEASEGKGYVMDYVAAALAAYSANHRQDKELALRAWHRLYLNSPRRYKEQGFVGDIYARTEDGVLLEELDWVSTNYVSQWCLNVIVTLDLIRDCLPALEEAKRIAAIPHTIAK